MTVATLRTRIRAAFANVRAAGHTDPVTGEQDVADELGTAIFDNAGAPTPHASTHRSGGGDPLLPSPGPIGATTPGTGKFTTLEATGAITPTGGIKSADGRNMREKFVDIVNWNMDTTPTKDVAHELTYAKIILIIATVRNDADTARVPLNYSSTGGGDPRGGVFADGTNCKLHRVTGGGFDNASYAAVGGFVRGWVYIKYII